MDKFDAWFGRFLYATEVIFLAASMPHIAAWFAHFDNPTDFWSTAYAWGIGFALAFAIDGVAFMLLLAIFRMTRRGKSINKSVLIGLIAFMLFIAFLSCDINWQYDVQNASDAFAKADKITLLGSTWTVGSLNPFLGGAFQMLILAYALIGKAMTTEQKAVVALTDEEFARAKKRLEQEKELKEMRRGDGLKGKITEGQQILGSFNRSEEKRKARLDAVENWLRNAPEMLVPAKEKEALRALALFLKIKEKEVLAYLIPARAIVTKEMEKPERDLSQIPVLSPEDKLQKALDFLCENGLDSPDEMLANYLGLERPASALFWKRKAEEILKGNPSFSQRKTGPITGPLTPKSAEESEQEEAQISDEGEENNQNEAQETKEHLALQPEMIAMITQYPKSLRLLDTSDTTILVEEVADIFGRTSTLIKNRAEAKKITWVKGHKKVTIESVIKWANQELVRKGNSAIIDLEFARNSQRNSGEIPQEKISG